MEEERKAYSEVVEILKLIEDNEKIEKIPFEVIQLIKQKSDPTYKPEILKEIPLEEQNLKKQTYMILAWISKKYWGEDITIDNESEESKQIDVEKSETLEEFISVFNDIEPEIIERDELEKSLPILVVKIKWYQKIKIQVSRVLKLIFRRKEGRLEEGANG